MAATAATLTSRTSATILTAILAGNRLNGFSATRSGRDRSTGKHRLAEEHYPCGYRVARSMFADKIDLESGQTRMVEVETVDASSTIRLLEAIEALYPMLTLIHVFLDNARYHHARLVQEWLAQPGRRIQLHFIPPYCPHLNPIERLWGLMHKHVTHNTCYATCREFAEATLGFLRDTVPKNWAGLCDSVTDNFRVISPKDFRVMT